MSVKNLMILRCVFPRCWRGSLRGRQVAVQVRSRYAKVCELIPASVRTRLTNFVFVRQPATPRGATAARCAARAASARPNANKPSYSNCARKGPVFAGTGLLLLQTAHERWAKPGFHRFTGRLGSGPDATADWRLGQDSTASQFGV
jgi:hypothetical protein